MFVELVYDKRNFEGLPGAKNIILDELTKRLAAFSRMQKFALNQ
jgi:hypothetical protein